LELTREVARRFNHLYRPVFPEPEALLTAYPKVPGLDGRKMSKSYDNAIYLSETVEEMGAKIKVMVTDPARKRRNDPGDPNVCPAFGLHLIFTGEEDRAVIDKECRRAGIGCVDCKKILIQGIERGIGPLVERRRSLASRWSDVEEAARAGTDRARGVARETMREVREAMGLT
jgi:tryptophanyl-tRNA synthetase